MNQVFVFLSHSASTLELNMCIPARTQNPQVRDDLGCPVYPVTPIQLGWAFMGNILVLPTRELNLQTSCGVAMSPHY